MHEDGDRTTRSRARVFAIAQDCYCSNALAPGLGSSRLLDSTVQSQCDDPRVLKEPCVHPLALNGDSRAYNPVNDEVALDADCGDVIAGDEIEPECALPHADMLPLQVIEVYFFTSPDFNSTLALNRVENDDYWEPAIDDTHDGATNGCEICGAKLMTELEEQAHQQSCKSRAKLLVDAVLSRCNEDVDLKELKNDIRARGSAIGAVKMWCCAAFNAGANEIGGNTLFPRVDPLNAAISGDVEPAFLTPDGSDSIGRAYIGSDEAEEYEASQDLSRGDASPKLPIRGRSPARSPLKVQSMISSIIQKAKLQREGRIEKLEMMGRQNELLDIVDDGNNVLTSDSAGMKNQNVGTESFVPVSSIASARKLATALQDSTWGAFGVFFSNLASSFCGVLESRTADCALAFVAGRSVSPVEHKFVYIPCSSFDADHVSIKDAVRDCFLSFIRSHNQVAIIFNSQLFWRCALKLLEIPHGIATLVNVYDPAVAAWMLNPDGERKDLLSVCRIYAPYLAAEAACSAAAATVESILEQCKISAILWEKSLAPAVSEASIVPAFCHQEMALTVLLAELENHGVKVDSLILRELYERANSRIKDLENRVLEYTDHKFNIRSPSHVARVVFDELRLPYPENKNFKSRSTSSTILEQLSDLHPMPTLILQHRKLAKLVSSYISPLLEHACEENGLRVHCHWNHLGTATGRLSSSNPINIQSIPSDAGDLRVRLSLIPSSSDLLLCAGDYRQMEVRVLAHLSRDPNLAEIIAIDSMDVYEHVAARLFGKQVEGISVDERRRAKTIFLGVLYGLGSRSLASKLLCSHQEAQDIVNAFMSRFPQLKAYIATIIEQCRRTGYITTVAGRRRYLPDVRSEDWTLRKRAERQAVNSLVQGSAADVVKTAMLQLRSEFRRIGWGSVLMQIHDEIVVEVPSEHLVEACTLMRDCMRCISEWGMHLPVLIYTGPSFGQLTEYRVQEDEMRLPFVESNRLSTNQLISLGGRVTPTSLNSKEVVGELGAKVTDSQSVKTSVVLDIKNVCEDIKDRLQQYAFQTNGHNNSGQQGLPSHENSSIHRQLS